MRDMTKSAIKKLVSETSHALSVEDYDLIERLDLIAEKISGVSRVERRLLNQPFDVAGIRFYPLTVAKSMWYIEKVAEWEIPVVYQDGFYFWLLTLPLNDESLTEFSEYKAANKAMKKMAKSLHLTRDEITDICSKCCGIEANKAVNDSESNDDSDSVKKGRNVFGGMIAALIREFGQSPEYWLYECPIDQLNEMYAQLVARVNAEDESVRASSGKKGKAIAPRATPKLFALKEFRDEVKKIGLKWSKSDGR